MAKFGPPKMSNPAAPKRTVTPKEAEKALMETSASEPEGEITNDSDTTAEQEILDELGIEDDDQGEEPLDDDEEITDKPTVAQKVVAAKTKGSNLSPEQQKYWDEIGKLGVDQGKGVASLISLAEKVVTIGANGVFESSHLKAIYMHFRKNSNTAAGKNREFKEGADDHTITVQTSKLRSFYKVGERFRIDGWSKMLKVARDIHVDILRDKDERRLLRSKQLIPTYEALVKVASEQMKKETDAKGVKHDKYPQLLTEDQIRNVFIDPEKKEQEPTVKDVIDAAAKAIERVIRGKVNPSTGEQTREAFEHPGTEVDDESVGYALTSSLQWMLDAGERYQVGYKANREKEMAEAKAAAEERHRKHEERMAKEEAERQARAAKKKADKEAKAAEAALAKEAAA